MLLILLLLIPAQCSREAETVLRERGSRMELIRSLERKEEVCATQQRPCSGLGRKGRKPIRSSGGSLGDQSSYIQVTPTPGQKRGRGRRGRGGQKADEESERSRECPGEDSISDPV